MSLTKLVSLVKDNFQSLLEIVQTFNNKTKGPKLHPVTYLLVIHLSTLSTFLHNKHIIRSIYFYTQSTFLSSLPNESIIRSIYLSSQYTSLQVYLSNLLFIPSMQTYLSYLSTQFSSIYRSTQSTFILRYLSFTPSIRSYLFYISI